MPMSEGRDSATDGSHREGDGFQRLDEPRGDRSREWELFVRESGDEALHHAGSVSAPTVKIAREQATTLFGFAVETLWLCPTDETVRLVAEDVALCDRAEEYDEGGDATETGTEADDGRAES